MSSAIVDYVRESKYRELCFAIRMLLEPNIRDFRNQLRAYFSNQQKEVIKAIRHNPEQQPPYYDVQKYIDKLLIIYKDQINKVFKKGQKRAELEAVTKFDEDTVSILKDSYISNTAQSIVQGIESTTIKKLTNYYNKFMAGELTKEEYQKKIEEFYNDCKGWRSNWIALTEVYRIFNYAYFNLMVLKGYTYKMYIGCFMGEDSKSKLIHKQVKFFAEYFVIPNCDNCIGLFPPLHPCSRATIIMLRPEDVGIQ